MDLNFFQQGLLMLIPPTLAGIAHMVIVKLNMFKFLVKPININLFGDNKTYRGFIIMIMSSIIFTFFTQYLDHIWKTGLFPNDIIKGIKLGVLLGLAYALFELPNSYWKRLKKIPAGKTPEEGRWLHIIIDQGDSVLGCALVYGVWLDPPISLLILLVFLGVFVHLAFNFLLYLVKIRKEPF